MAPWTTRGRAKVARTPCDIDGCHRRSDPKNLSVRDANGKADTLNYPDERVCPACNARGMRDFKRSKFLVLIKLIDDIQFL
jgi:hypothetical protein